MEKVAVTCRQVVCDYHQNKTLYSVLLKDVFENYGNAYFEILFLSV